MQKIQTDLSVDEAIARFSRIQTIKPRRVALYEAIGQRIAEDVIVRRPSPAKPLAARDGWAVKAAETVGATKRQPRALKTSPYAIDIGHILPDGMDSVVGTDVILERARGMAAIEQVRTGQGVICPADQVQESQILIKAGSLLTLAAAMSAGLCGVLDVMIRRPVVDIILNSPGAQSPSTQFTRMVAAAIRTSGSGIGAITVSGGEPNDFKRAILESSADVICTIGGTGMGPGDCTIDALAEIGEVLVHGVRLKPGGTFGFALVNDKPIFASPGGLADMLVANIVFSSAFARRAFGRPPAATVFQEAKLAEPIPSPGETSSLIFGTVEDGKFMPILKEQLSPLDVATAQAVIFLPEGARHKRAGEVVSYSRLGVAM